MLVVIANNLPPAVRGRMKIWFVEPRANVFVSGIRDAAALKVVEFLYEYCPPSSGLIVFRKINEPPGYEIKTKGSVKNNLKSISGLQLIVEKIM